MSTSTGLGVAVVVVAAVLALTATGGVAAQEACRTIDGTQVCVESASLSDDWLVVGDRGEVSATVENTGNATASPLVILTVGSPNNETGVYRIGQPTLDPGESTTVSQPLDANTTGTHTFRIQTAHGASQQVYDTSESLTLDVREEPPTELGGPIDRTEIALVALALTLVGMVALGYRQLRDTDESTSATEL